MIHSTAIVSNKAEIADDVEIGPYSIIGDGVVIGSGTRIESHVVVNGPTRIIPGTHHSKAQIPSLEDEPEWMRLSTVCPVPAGTAMIRDLVQVAKPSADESPAVPLAPQSDAPEVAEKKSKPKVSQKKSEER